MRNLELTDLLDKSHYKFEADNIIKALIDKSWSFRKIIDKAKNEQQRQYFRELLEDVRLFEKLVEHNLLTKKDLKYLLSKIDRIDEISDLDGNTPLLKYILSKFVLDKELVEKLNRIIVKKNPFGNCFLNIRTIFEFIEAKNKNNKELLKLNELNRYTYWFDLNDSQREELYKTCRESERVKNNLNQIVENNLESQYNFEQLKEMITKDEKKTKIKMNF